MELLDLYDDNGNKLNKIVQRGQKFEQGKIMLSIVFIKNSDNNFLIQMTSKEKGSKYGFTGGHVVHNETPLECITREIREELGLVINDSDLKFIAIEKHLKKSCLFNLYELNKDIDIDTLILQKEEVEKVLWLNKDEVLKLIENNMFIESHAFLFKIYLYEEWVYEKSIICYR